MKKTATNEELAGLHKAVAEVLTTAIEADVVANQQFLELPPTYDDNGDEVQREPPKMNPALIAVAVKFLKDNLVTSSAEDDEAMSKLEEALARKRKRSTVRNIPVMDDDDEQTMVQ